MESPERWRAAQRSSGGKGRGSLGEERQVLCDNFRVDILSGATGLCKCGHPKAAHPVLAPLPGEDPAVPDGSSAADSSAPAALAAAPAAPATAAAAKARDPNKKPTICGSLVLIDSAEGTLQLHWTQNWPVRPPPPLASSLPLPPCRLSSVAASALAASDLLLPIWLLPFWLLPLWLLPL